MNDDSRMTINRYPSIDTWSGRYAAEIQLSDFRFCASTINDYFDWPTVLLSGIVIVPGRNDFDGHSRVTRQFAINLTLLCPIAARSQNLSIIHPPSIDPLHFGANRGFPVTDKSLLNQPIICIPDICKYYATDAKGQKILLPREFFSSLIRCTRSKRR